MPTPTLILDANGLLGNALFQQIGQGLVSKAGSTSHPFEGSDASAGGGTGLISVVAGSVKDETNSGTLWSGLAGANEITINDPTYGVVPFAVLVGSGSSARLPHLALSGSATRLYLNATVSATTGFITAIEIDADSGGGLPTSTSTHWYSPLAGVAVTVTSGVATVSITDDGAQSNLFFAICGAVPLTDGTQYREGT